MSDEQKPLSLSKFNLSGFLVLREFQGSRTMNLNAFNGGVSFSIWDSNQRGAPVDNISLTRPVVRLLNRAMKNIIKAQPNTTVTIGQHNWDRNANGGKGGWVKGNMFKFIKDDKQTYALEVSTPKLSLPLKTVFKGPKFTVDTDDLTESERSELALMNLIETLDFDVPMMRLLSRLNMPKPSSFSSNKTNINVSNNMSDGGAHSGGRSYTSDDEAPY